MSTSHIPSKGSQRALPLTASQPFVYPWVVANVLTLVLVKIPVWSILYLLPTWRPNRNWTWKQALGVRLVRFHFYFSTSLRPNWDIAPIPGRWSGPTEGFEAVEPVSEELLRGVAAPANTSVRAAQRPGSWYPSHYEPAVDGDKNVLLYFCRGAYVIGGHTANLYQTTIDKLLPVANAKFFGVGYRFASNKGAHFPTQLVDALSAYQHLLKKGVPASKIILVGDSAGGNLHIALLRYLTEHPDLLPLPAAGIFAGPWVDMTNDFNYNDRPASPKFKTDTLHRDLPDWGAHSVIPGDMKADNPYFAPRFHPFKVPVPLWVEAGADEVPFDSIAAFVEAMQSQPGNDVQFHITENGVHDLFVLGDVIGFPDSVDNMMASIRIFLGTRNLL